MNFVADECCDAVLVEGLRSSGHDIVYIREIAAGVDDRTVLQMAADKSRILLTEDKDFGELVIRLGLPVYGIILSRIDPADSATKLARLNELIVSHSNDLPGAFVVLTETRTRIRRINAP